MEEKKLKMLERFVNEKIPEVEKNRVILIVEDKSFTWKQVLEELKKGSNLAGKIEKKLEEMTE